MNYSNDFIEPYGSFIFDGSTTLASAKNMNKLGDQYNSGVYLIDHHNHNDNYYTKEEMDAKYFRDDFKVGSDADKVDGDHLTDLIGGSLPKYSIIAWESPIVPTGYALCNGQISNGVTTIDMRDYFVPTAGSSYTLNQTFGNNLFTLTGTISIASHALSIGELPNHRHLFYDYYASGALWSYGEYAYKITGNADTASQNTGSTGSSGGHIHTGSISMNQNNADNRPSFYALYFIEKVI